MRLPVALSEAAQYMFSSSPRYYNVTYYAHNDRFLLPRWIVISNSEVANLLEPELRVEADDALIGEQPDASALAISLKRRIQ